MHRMFWLITGIVLLLLTACRQDPSEPTPLPVSTVAPTEARPTTPPQTFTAQLATYDLGEATIVQDNFPEDSRFREMPVRLKGVIGAPEETGNYPVVLILHGSHFICPDEMLWPCPEEDEQANYAGFTYLVEALANAGYVALSIDVNAEHTFAFGEAPMTLRTRQLIDLHLQALEAANAGTSDDMGLELTDQVDLSRMVWIGHSRGADLANWIAREQQLDQKAGEHGFGPLQGLILVAPPVLAVDTLPAVDLQTALILPTCDADVINLDGQALYESARFDPDRSEPFVSIYLEHGTHNNFNTVLPPDSLLTKRPDCSEELLLTPEEQQTFLTQYAIDFLSTLYGSSVEQDPAEQRLGWDLTQPAPTELYDRPVQISISLPTARRLTLMQPYSEDELTQNLLGGATTLVNSTAIFCPEGYYVPNMDPLSVPCRRVNFNQPGYPQQLLLEWTADGAGWRTSLPEGSTDLSQFVSLQLRAGLDPLSELNSEGQPQSFTVELVDANGQQSRVSMSAIPFPEGVRQPNEFFDGEFFTGHVYLHALRVPLTAFEGVNLSDINELALVFNQKASGTLLLADLELVKTEDS